MASVAATTPQRALLRVLTTPQLFRLVAHWTIRWPSRLAERWCEFQRELDERERFRRFPIAKPRRVELFVRELMTTRDAETLRLAALATWRIDAHSHVQQAFPIKDLQFAVRAGGGETLRVALAFATVKLSSATHDWFWKEAIDHFPGHCDVLDVLKMTTQPTRHQLEGLRGTCRRAAVLEWITLQLEAKPSLPLPPAKRLRIGSRDARPSFSHPLRLPSTVGNNGHAAFRVLTNRQLFMLLPQWMDGWPTRLLRQWRLISSRIDQADALRIRRGFAVPKARKVSLFMRELMLAGDVATLRLAVQCTWQDDDDAHTKRPFPVTDLQFAIRSRDAETVRFAFEHHARTSNSAAFSVQKTTWFWREAIAAFTGEFRVLEVLMEFAPPPPDILTISGEAVNDVETAEWFVTHLGAVSLLPSTIILAALRGNLALVQYLSTISGQDVASAVSRATSYEPSVSAFLQTLQTN